MRASITAFLLAAACTRSPPTVTTVIATTSASASASAAASANTGDGPRVRSYFVTPSDLGLQPVLDEIANAKKSIRMMMFHLTVPDIVDALIAAKARGVDVRIILDAKNLDNRASGAIAQRLGDRGIEVTRSSPAFSITHVKAFVVDDTRAVVMSLNLTRPFEHTRDYAVVTDDAAVVADFLKVFDADVDNAAHRTAKTPDGLASTALVWSPESEARIVKLIDSAHATIAASTENLGDRAIGAAFGRAANRGVKVRLLVPMCDLGNDATRNLKFVAELDHANVDARVMPPPATREQPYTHAKMMIIDGAQLFLGSINFSENSTRHARELAIIIGDHAAISAVTTSFEADWRFAAPPPPPKTENVCPRDQTALPIAW